MFCGQNASPNGESQFFSDGKHMIFIELCAGSAVLSAAAQKHGHCVMSVDFKRNGHRPMCKVVSLDLSEDHAWGCFEIRL